MAVMVGFPVVVPFKFHNLMTKGNPMEYSELVKHLQDIDAHLNVLRGRQIAGNLVLEMLLRDNPGALQTLQSLDLEKAGWLMQGRPVPDECIHHAIDQLTLFRGT